MKKYYILFVVFCLLLYNVFAVGTVYEISIDYGENKLFTLSERDMLRLNIDNKEHYIKIDKVYSDGDKVDLAIFIKGVETPNYVTIGKDKHIQLDFERDKTFDLKVGLKEVNGKNVTLILVRPLKQEVTGYATKTTYSGISILGILITIFVIIFGLVIYLLIKKKS